MTSFFADVLAKEEWLKLLDNLFINKSEPELIVYFCASFILNNKAQILQIGCIEELQGWQMQTTSVSFKKLMSLTTKLHAQYKTSLNIGNYEHRLPLCGPESGSVYQ